jgi:hypothetical protein
MNVTEATNMKPVRAIGAGLLLLLLGAVAPTYAQQDQHQQEDAKAPKQEQQAQPKPAQQQHQQQAQAKPAQQQHQQQAQAKPAQQQQQASNQKNQQQQQARSFQRPERTQQAVAIQRSEPALRLSSRSESRIPDDRFSSNFGRGHEFRIGSPRLVDGYSRFQYGGYWFGFLQPWPSDWYYTDDVYVDYIDGGYYLCDPYYPGERVSINVVL